MGNKGLPAFNLPRLTAAVDCGPIGYPGLKVHFWLNVTYDPDRETDEEWAKRAAQHKEETSQDLPPRARWENDYYYGFGRIVVRVEVPADLAGGEAADIPIGDGKALYDLMTSRGFEQQIILWSAQHYYELKAERLQAETKN